jgi:hypothetical protein
MKKVLLFAGALIIASANLHAQESTFLKGDKVLNLGLGLGSTLYSGSILFKPDTSGIRFP